MKKIGDSFKGILGGFIFIVIGIIVLWWNEGNNVKNIKTTKEMEEVYVEVPSDSVNAQNEGKLIATHGKLLNEQELTDDTFSVTVKTPKLNRVVEVYQWEEESHTDEDDNTTYTYNKVWSETLIDSSNFNKSGHENPTSVAYSSAGYLSTDVKVGAFSLNDSQISSLSTNKEYNQLTPDVAEPLGMTVNGNYYTTSQDVNNPQIGDLRVSFKYNDSTDISVLAVQTGSTFTKFVSKVGKSESRLVDGIHSGQEMIENIKSENKLTKWLLRFAGIMAVVLGIATILKPISTISGFVPILGNVVQGMVGFVSFLLGLGISLIVIAIAWFRFRPVLSIILIAVVAGIIVVLKVFAKKKQSASNATAPVSATSATTPVSDAGSPTITIGGQTINNTSDNKTEETPSKNEENNNQ